MRWLRSSSPSPVSEETTGISVTPDSCNPWMADSIALGVAASALLTTPITGARKVLEKLGTTCLGRRGSIRNRMTAALMEVWIRTW